MPNHDETIERVLKEYGEDFASNTWLVPGGKARAILHKCIERMAAKAGVTFDAPVIVSANPENVVVIVTGRMDDKSEWSFGEASPKNNKNAYPFSMAEKRGKDRVALKLIGLHGLLYSEEEADELKNGDGATEAIPPKPATRLEITSSSPDPAAYLRGCEVVLAGFKTRLAIDNWWRGEKHLGRFDILNDEQYERLSGMARERVAQLETAR